MTRKSIVCYVFINLFLFLDHVSVYTTVHYIKGSHTKGQNGVNRLMTYILSSNVFPSLALFSGYIRSKVSKWTVKVSFTFLRDHIGTLGKNGG